MSCYHRLKEITIYQTEQYITAVTVRRGTREVQRKMCMMVWVSFTSNWLWVAFYYLIRVYKNQSSS